MCSEVCCSILNYCSQRVLPVVRLNILSLCLAVVFWTGGEDLRKDTVSEEELTEEILCGGFCLGYEGKSVRGLVSRGLVVGLGCGGCLFGICVYMCRLGMGWM